MIRIAVCITLGLLFGAIVAALVVPYVGLIGFSGSYLQVVVVFPALPVMPITGIVNLSRW